MTSPQKRNSVLASVLAGTLLSATAAVAETRALVIAGLGGDEHYEAQFQRHANTAANQLRRVADDLTLLVGDAVDRNAVESSLQALATRSASDDALVFLFIGHGSYNNEHFKFNVPGPDFTAAELHEWLEPVHAKRQVVVVTGSSSGAIQGTLEKDGRAVISATRSGGERNATVFGRYFAEALSSGSADLDKDERITTQEAFSFAAASVADYYESQQTIASEHPQLTGGGTGTTILARLEGQPSFDPRAETVLSQRQALEDEITLLRASKDDYPQEEYYAELQRLLLELVVVETQLEEAAEREAR